MHLKFIQKRTSHLSCLISLINFSNQERDPKRNFLVPHKVVIKTLYIIKALVILTTDDELQHNKLKAKRILKRIFVFYFI